MAVITALALVGTFLLYLIGLVQIHSFLTSIAMMPTLLLILALVVHYSSSPANQRVFSNRLVVGFWASLCATFFQDLSEVLLYFAGLLQFSIIRQITLVNPASAAWGTAFLSFAYHLIYFVTIGMTYALIAGRANWFYGLGWALVLEIYEWQEFLTFVALIHVVYGITLGLLIQRFAKR